jgi:GNAT superfamily N-acetyltransferase
MAQIEVRRAAAEDLADVMLILDRFAEAGHSDVQCWLGNGGTWVAERGGSVVGFIVSERSFFGNEFVELLQVLPTARRLGVASGLLEMVSRHRRSPKLFTSTNLSNGAMQGVLSRLGWSSAGIVHGLDDGDPELFYRAPSR